MLNFFSKKPVQNEKKDDEVEKQKEIQKKTPTKVINKNPFIETPQEKRIYENKTPQEEEKKEEENEKSVEIDYNTQQCIDMGMDIKHDVEKSSSAFFNSKNEKKSSAYTKFQVYLKTLEDREIQRIKDLSYMEFKEKEEQVQTFLKNGFAQFLSKGASLDAKNKEIVEFVFGDIKKYPSKGHRYWYYKVYLWLNSGF
ncbi:MAG: hypothetical protein ACNI25_15575 [Halarcobacter sp.]